MAQKAVPTKSDTIYKKIDEYAEDKKFFKFIHKLMFRKKEAVVSTKKPKRKGITPLQKSFDKYSCRIIRPDLIRRIKGCQNLGNAIAWQLLE